MAALVKSLLYDLADDRLDVITRTDLLQSLQRLRDRGDLSDLVLSCVQQSLAGYTCDEYAGSLAADVRHTLQVLVARIEADTRYTDAQFLERVLRIHPQYRVLAEVFGEVAERFGMIF